MTLARASKRASKAALPRVMPADFRNFLALMFSHATFPCRTGFRLLTSRRHPKWLSKTEATEATIHEDEECISCAGFGGFALPASTQTIHQRKVNQQRRIGNGVKTRAVDAQGNQASGAQGSPLKPRNPPNARGQRRQADAEGKSAGQRVSKIIFPAASTARSMTPSTSNLLWLTMGLGAIRGFFIVRGLFKAGKSRTPICRYATKCFGLRSIRM